MKAGYENYMRQCLNLAKLALAAGNPPVGAIIVLDGEVIGTGIESGRTSGDVINHAEILAVRDAIKNGYEDQLHLSVMITTHEPCIMCSYVIRHHHIPEIVYGTAVPFVGGATSKFNILSTQDVPKWAANPKIIGGICSAECNALSEQFRQSLIKS
ncbi:nucleoside deaminase [Mucilaginibacter gynuensis]